MVTANATRARDEGLAQAIHHHIDHRTWGRLRGLQVQTDGHRVIVHGSSPSYYLIQLALLAVRELLPAQPVKLAVQVVPPCPHAPEGGRAAGATSAQPRPGPRKPSRRPGDGRP